MKTNQLHLILTHHWFDMIESGVKRTEFRDFSMRYAKLLQNKNEVVFHRGYTKTTMQFKILDLKVHIINAKDVMNGLAPIEWLKRMVYAIDFEEMEQENETQTLD